MKNIIKNLTYAVLVFGIVSPGIAWGAAGEPTLEAIHNNIHTIIKWTGPKEQKPKLTPSEQAKIKNFFETAGLSYTKDNALNRVKQFSKLTFTGNDVKPEQLAALQQIDTIIKNINLYSKSINNMNTNLQKNPSSNMVDTFKKGINKQITTLQDNLQKINQLALSENQQIEVWISYASTPNESRSISINNNAQIKDLKQKIFTDTGGIIPVNFQTLTFGDIPLKDDERTLSSYGILDKSAIVVALPKFK